MTNRSDLDKYCAQIELVKQLLGPETFDLDKILIKLETKKKLLMAFKPRSYATILEDLESGAIKHPGDWVLEEKKIKTPEEIKKLLETRQAKAEEIRLAKEVPEEPKIDKRAITLEKAREVKAAKAKKEAEKELQDAKDKLAELETLKEQEKEEVTVEEEGE